MVKTQNYTIHNTTMSETGKYYILKICDWLTYKPSKTFVDRASQWMTLTFISKFYCFY